MAAAAKLQSTAPTYDRPAPTAGAVLEQRAARQHELAALESLIGETAYGAAVAGKDGVAALAALHSKIAAARFAVDCNAAAHAHALEVDRAALAEWWTEVHAMAPDAAIEGISKTECCRRCSVDGCLITGAECGHPLKAGQNLNPRHQDNPAVRAQPNAARPFLGVYRRKEKTKNNRRI
jgi:hypothetical protein